MKSQEWKQWVDEGGSVAQSFLSTLLKRSAIVDLVSEKWIVSGSEEASEKERSVSMALDFGTSGDLLLQLDEAWLATLSNRMMGVEQTTLNEVTRDLLKRFVQELTSTIAEALKREGVHLVYNALRFVNATRWREQVGGSRLLQLTIQVTGVEQHPLSLRLWIGSDSLPNSLEIGEEIMNEEEVGEEDAQSRSEAESGREPESESGASGKTHPAQKPKEPVMSGEKNDFESVRPEEMATVEATEEPVISGRHVQFEEFEEKELTPEKGARGLELLKDIEMDLSVELGRIELPLGKVLELTRGSVIELERLAGEPVDILVNGHKIAYGEVVVIDEHFGVRVSNLITTRKKLVELK